MERNFDKRFSKKALIYLPKGNPFTVKSFEEKTKKNTTKAKRIKIRNFKDFYYQKESWILDKLLEKKLFEGIDSRNPFIKRTSRHFFCAFLMSGFCYFVFVSRATSSRKKTGSKTPKRIEKHTSACARPELSIVGCYKV